MEHRYLGTSGLMVSEMAMGNWITHAGQIEEQAAVECVHAALDAGITTFDTADIYAATKAEEVLGRKVNPTLYAAEDFSKKLRSDNHFLTRIVQQPKIMLIGDDNDLPTGNSAESGEDRQAQG